MSCNNSIVGSIELVSKQAVPARVTASFELPLDILGPIVDKKGLDGHLQYTKSYCGLLDFVPKDVVHHSLKCSGGIAHSKEHDRRFVQSKWRRERCLPSIFFLDLDVIVSPAYVKLGEVCCSL